MRSSRLGGSLEQDVATRDCGGDVKTARARCGLREASTKRKERSRINIAGGAFRHRPALFLLCAHAEHLCSHCVRRTTPRFSDEPNTSSPSRFASKIPSPSASRPPPWARKPRRRRPRRFIVKRRASASSISSESVDRGGAMQGHLASAAIYPRTTVPVDDPIRASAMSTASCGMALALFDAARKYASRPFGSIAAPIFESQPKQGRRFAAAVRQPYRARKIPRRRAEPDYVLRATPTVNV